MTDKTVLTPERMERVRELLRTTVEAKTAYWDRLAELEAETAPDGEWSDAGNDRITELVEDLAAGAGDEVRIEDEHVTDVIEHARPNDYNPWKD